MDYKDLYVTLESEAKKKKTHTSFFQIIIDGEAFYKHLPHIYNSFFSNDKLEPVRYYLSKEDIKALAAVCAYEYDNPNLTYLVLECLYDKCVKKREVYIDVELEPVA